MKSLILGRCAPVFVFSVFLVSSAISAHAQSGIPNFQTPRFPQIAWICEADCFEVGGDGNDLYYGGHRISALYWHQSDAQREIKKWCSSSGILVTRDLKSMETQTTIDSRSESWSEETVRAGWYFRETKSSGGSRSYQIVNTHTRGVFDVKKGMSCSPQSIFAKPVFVTADGDTVRD